MIKKLRDRIKNRIGKKKGATMLIVITTMSLLIIIGSGFASLSFYSYRHSYGALCRQQALFTAKSVLDGFLDEFKASSTLRESVLRELNDVVATHPDEDVTEQIATINVKNLYDILTENTNPANDDDDDDDDTPEVKEKQDCTMKVSYFNKEKTKIKLSVESTYKGFKGVIGVILAYTNKASMELSKIMNNALYFCTPIINFVCNNGKSGQTGIVGDVYVDSAKFGDNNNNGVDDFYENIRAKEALLAGTPRESDKGTTLKMNIDGTPRALPKEWVEVYIRTWEGSPLTGNLAPAINGNLKCNTDVLLGLSDKASGGYAHGYGDFKVGFDGEGQAGDVTCLWVRDDIYVNGDARGENMICNNLYVVDNDPTDGKYKGNFFGQFILQHSYSWINPFYSRSNVKINGNAIVDGYFVMNGGDKDTGKVGGSIYAGRRNADGTLWGTKGTFAYNAENGELDEANTKLGTGDVSLSGLKEGVGGDIYAEGNVYIKDGTEVYGNVYAKGNVYIKNSTVYGKVYCGGDMLVNESRAGRPHVAEGNVYVGGKLTAKGYAHNTDTYTHFLGDVTVKGDINVWTRIVFGRWGNGANVYCGGNLSMVDYCSFDNNGGTLFVRGKAKINNSWVKCRSYIKGDNIYGAIYVGDRALNTWNTKYENYIYAPSLSNDNYSWRNGLRKYYRQSYVTNNDIPKKENVEFLNSLEKNTTKEIAKGKANKKELFDKVSLYNKNVNALVKKWNSPKPSNYDETQGGAKYPDEYANKKIGYGGHDIFKAQDGNGYVISENVLNSTGIELGDNEILTIDTSKKNIHIVLKGDLKVGKNAQIIVKGSNMAFIYLEAAGKQYVVIENGAEIGGTQSVNGGSTDNAGLYIISNKRDVEFKIIGKVGISSFNYIPYGELDLEKAGVRKQGYEFKGSFVIGYVDMGNWLDVNVNTGAAWATYRYTKSPLVLDVTNDLQYGNNAAEILGFGEITWEAVDYV